MRLAMSAACLLLLLGTAVAEEPKQPAKPMTAKEAADAVLEAVKAKDDKALKALAEKGSPDPWLVADALCYRGEHDAAGTFAIASKPSRKRFVEKLPAYVDSMRKSTDDEGLRKAPPGYQCRIARE